MPDKPLVTAAEIKELYVNRPGSPLKRLKLLLSSSQDPQKVLFTGHRGSGKSTELAKLTHLFEERAQQTRPTRPSPLKFLFCLVPHRAACALLENEFFIFRYSVTDRLNIYDITYVDVLLALGLEIFAAAVRARMKLSDALYKQILNFTKEISTTISTGAPVSGEVGGEINFLIAKLNAKLKVEDQTRREVRETASPRLSTLLETVDLVARSIEAETGKRVLALVEDLDKLDPAVGKQLFYDHGASLSAPRLSIIYTFPIALRHDNSFVQVKMNFPTVYVLPIFKTRQKDGAVSEEGLTMCEEVLTRRATRQLFEAGVIRTLAKACGGVPRLLISYARQACVETMVDEAAAIRLADSCTALQNSRRDYEVLLSKEQLAALKTVHATRAIDNDEVHRALLHNLSCLEYWNDDVWYDVHPIVEPLLEEK